MKAFSTMISRIIKRAHLYYNGNGCLEFEAFEIEKLLQVKIFSQLENDWNGKLGRSIWRHIYWSGSVLSAIL